MKEIQLEAKHLGFVRQCFEALQGPRPISLSLKIAKVLAEVDQAHELFRDKIKPCLNEQGEILDDQMEAAMEILDEQVALSVPSIEVQELEAAELQTVSDAAVLFLVQHSFVSEL